MVSGSLFLVAFLVASSVFAYPRSSSIYGGEVVGRCGWASVVAVDGGCSGTLVHPEVVVFAAHCGEDIDWVAFGESEEGGRRVATSRCETFRFSGEPRGRDVGFCLLAEPQFDVPIVPLAAGCELDTLSVGTEVVLVGFGLADDGSTGRKRQVSTVLQELTKDGELLLGGDGKDSCVGDSGGPAFATITGGSGDLETRQVGVASYGGPCGLGGYYSLLAPNIAWLEERTGVDLTPCHTDEGEWAPTGACGRFPLHPDRGREGGGTGCSDLARSGYSTACGRSFDPTLDRIGPHISLVSEPEFQVRSTGGWVRLTAEVDDGAGSGVMDVSFELGGQVLERERRSVDVWEAEVFVEPGEYWIRVNGRDVAGNTSSLGPEKFEVRHRDDGDDGKTVSCSIGTPRTTGGCVAWVALIVGAGFARRGRRGSR